MNYFNIENSIKLYKSKKIERIYVMIDIHGTILAPRLNKNEISTEFYLDSKEVLRFLSNTEDFYLMLSTCSYPDQVKAYLDILANEGIYFKGINENREVDTNFGEYVIKPYANIILDDKAGFEGHDWTPIKEILKKYYPELL